MHHHGKQATDETGSDIEPVPCLPVPATERYIVAIVVVDILKLHATHTADAHEQRAEERQHEDANKMFPAVTLR